MKNKLRMPIWALLELNDVDYEMTASSFSSEEPVSMNTVEFLENEELIPNEKAFNFQPFMRLQQGD